MQNQAIYANASPYSGDATPQSEVGKINDQFDAAESLYARVMDLARHLVGEYPVEGSSISGQKNGGTLGDLAYRAEYLSDYAAKANEEINRIYRAASF